jgi:hypothetical protein
MRSISLDRFNSASVALVAMAGYVVWHSIMNAIGASTATAWVIASVLALGGIAWATLRILRALPTPVEIVAPMRIAATMPKLAGVPDADLRFTQLRGESSDIRRRLLLPIQQRLGWRFDQSPKLILDPEVERLAPFVQPELERALVGILENPLANPPAVVKGEMLRIQRVHPSVPDVPPLLLAYTTNRRDQLIPTLALVPSADVVPQLAAARGDRKTLEALHRVEAAAERALGESGQRRLAEHEA